MFQFHRPVLFLFPYHKDGSKKLDAHSSFISCMVFFNLNIKISSFTDRILQYLHIINTRPTRLLLPATQCLLFWRTSSLARGGEFLSTLVPDLLTTAPPLASPFALSHPTHRSHYNVYIDDISNTSLPHLAQFFISVLFLITSVL
jgi:hypothetical protein